MTKEKHADGKAKQGQNGHDYTRPFGHLHGVVIAATWVFVLLLLASLFWPNLTERTKFFTANLWNLVIAFTVIAQVKINQQQWRSMVDGLDRTDKMIENMQGQLTSMQNQESAMQGQLAAMERQEKTMRDQVKIMADSLIIGQRSYVGIADLGDFSNSRVVIKIENRGGVPAENVKLRLDALGGIKEDYANKTARRTFRKPFSHDYGRAKLFRGSLPFTYSVVLEDFLSDQEIALLREGKGVFGLRGHIDYHDGFDTANHQRTEFSYFVPEWRLARNSARFLGYKSSRKRNWRRRGRERS